MLRVRPFAPDDLWTFPELAEQLRAEGITQICGLAFAAEDDSGVLAIGGFVPMGGGTCEAWFHCARDLGQAGTRLVWETRGMLRSLMREHGWTRVQARIDPTNAKAVRFIKAMRFEREGTMRAYWYGKDRDLYARVIL